MNVFTVFIYDEHNSGYASTLAMNDRMIQLSIVE